VHAFAAPGRTDLLGHGSAQRIGPVARDRRRTARDPNPVRSLPRARSLCGCGCARRVASATRCRVTTTSKNTSPPISTVRACVMIPKGRCSARSGGMLPQANAYAMIRRRAAAGRDRNQARQLQLPGDRDHRVSQEWRHTGKGRGDGEPRLNAYDAALRPPPR